MKMKSLSLAEILKFLLFSAGFHEAGVLLFLLLRAPQACAPPCPDPAGLPKGPGAPAAP